MNNTSQDESLSSSYDDDLLGGDNTSPESAAIARGAARTAAARGTQRVMAGRLPVSSTATSVATKASKTISSAGSTPKIISSPRAPTTIPRVSVQNVPRIPKAPKIRVPKARANTIAKATDRASKGYDILSARLEQNQSVTVETKNVKDAKSHNSTKRRKHNNIQQYTKTITQALQQVASFGKIFITNTILGMALFATYEGVIDYVAPPMVENAITKEDDVLYIYSNIADVSNGDVSDGVSSDDIALNEIGDNDDAMDRATLPQHFLAGAMAGTSHAVLSLALEIKRNVTPSTAGKSTTNVTVTNLIQQHKPIHLQFPNLSYSAAYILHHSLAHSVLFGSYQLTKRLLIQNISPDPTTAGNGTNGSSGSNNNDAILHISCIAMAGGLAGQLQHVTSHISEQCFSLVDETTNSSSSLLRRLQLASWPTWRSTMLAFPPSAIGFLAFEYGKMMMADDH